MKNFLLNIKKTIENYYWVSILIFILITTICILSGCSDYQREQQLSYLKRDFMIDTSVYKPNKKLLKTGNDTISDDFTKSIANAIDEVSPKYITSHIIKQQIEVVYQINGKLRIESYTKEQVFDVFEKTLKALPAYSYEVFKAKEVNKNGEYIYLLKYHSVIENKGQLSINIMFFVKENWINKIYLYQE